ncbi:Uncharacterised protein r2_g2974 [Pycnogonum litorale]
MKHPVTFGLNKVLMTIFSSVRRIPPRCGRILLTIIVILTQVSVTAILFRILYNFQYYYNIRYILLAGMVSTSLILFSPLIWKFQQQNSGICLKIFKFFLLVLLLLIFSTWAAICFLSWNSLWCCLHDSDIQRLCNTAKEVDTILKRSNIPFFICYGSALGAYRQKGQHIKYEHDADFCIYSSFNKKFIKAIRASTFELESQGDAFFRVYIPGNYYQKTRQNFIKMWIDVYTICNSGTNNLRQCGVRKAVKRSCVEPLNTTISYCGSTYPKPFNITCYLESYYGSSYMTPIRDHLRNVTCTYSPVKC